MFRNVNVVDGTSITGVFAPNGSVNVFDATNINSIVGLYHPCGAINVTVAEAGTLGVYAPNGSVNVSEDPDIASGGPIFIVVVGNGFESPEFVVWSYYYLGF